jgi:hypothetical protein
MGERGLDGVISNYQKQHEAAIFDVSTLLGENKSKLPAITQAMIDNSNHTQVFQTLAEYRSARLAMVTLNGIRYLPQGVAHAVEYNIDNPGQFALKMGIAAGLGIAMRVALPKAGAVKALVGTLMGGMSVKDAAMPIVEGWADVWNDKSLTNLDSASKRMGVGLGHFAFDAVATLPVGIAADKLAGLPLTRTSWGRNFESSKERFWTSDESRVGRFFNWSTRTADATSNALSQRLQGKVPETPLTIDQKIALIAEAQRTHMTDAEAAKGGTVDDAFRAQLETQRRYRQDMPDQIEGLMSASPISEQARISLTNKRPSVVPVEPTPVGPTGPKGPYDARDVGTMAATVRDRAGKITEQDMAIADLREGWQSSLRATTLEPPGPPTLPLLDRGHMPNNAKLIELADQILTPEQVKEAGFLMEHFRVANQQLVLTEKLPEIIDLNNYSRSVHNKLMELLVKNGVKPDEVLRGTNSPMFLIFDSRAAGPYTIPAIKGVTDTPVVVLPREYQSMLGIHVSGVYPHELGHDLIYGDLLRFPEALRTKVLTENVVRSGMQQAGIADVPINVPGHGNISKSELFVRLLQAQANENTADWFGTAIDPNTGLSLAVLLGSLRKPAPGAPKGAPGALETRSMYGSEFADPANPLGIEVHGIDRWRIKSTAQVLREMSGGDKKILDYAAAMDKLADHMSRPGDTYAWANMDKPGEFFAIPQKEWDAIIPSIVRAQLDTPLDALNGRTLRQVFPDMRQTFPRVDTLADGMAEAALQGRPTLTGSFDKGAHRIEDVFSAGLSAWAKAMERNPAPGQPGHVPPDKLITNINAISESLRAQYRLDPPMPIPGMLDPGKVDFALAFKKPSWFVSQYLGKTVEAQPRVRQFFDNHQPFLTRAVGTGIPSYFNDGLRRENAYKHGFSLGDGSTHITPPPGSDTQPKDRGN